MSRRAIVLLVILALLLIVVGLRVWLSKRTGGEGIAGLFGLLPVEDRLILEPASFSDLSGWGSDAVEEAVPALLRSCERITPLQDDAPVDDELFAGKAGDWRPACAAAKDLPPGDRDR